MKPPVIVCAKCMGFLTILIGLSACLNQTERMSVPKVAITAPASVSKPVARQASFALGNVVSSIRRGTVIAHFPGSGINIGGNYCNYRHTGKSIIEWGSGSRHFGNWRSELGDVFFEVMRDRGVNIVGDPQDLFKQGEAARSAEYLLGARIKELRGNFCHVHHWWDGTPLRRYSGEFFIHVEWSVFSTLTERTVARIDTRGHFNREEATAQGITLAFIGAFSAAAENLLAEREFVKILEKEPAESSVAVHGSGPTMSKEMDRLVIRKIRESVQPIQKTIGQVLSAVVTVRVGGSHGSGFLISQSGHLLTNQHVVGEAKDVQIVFANGLEVRGKVLRRDAPNDVAIVQIPLRARSILPLRREGARQVEDVFAVGSPMDESFRASVTKGVVSALRMDKRTGQRIIQADVPISGGNSGGPLLDKFGNVIGITKSHLVHKRAQNINFFVPIQDALDVLGIELQSAKTSMRK